MGGQNSAHHEHESDKGKTGQNNFRLHVAAKMVELPNDTGIKE